MEQTEPLNSTHQVNIIKKILLFINVAACRINSSTSYASSSSRYTRTGPIMIASITDYIFAKYVFQLPAESHLRVFFSCVVFHTVVDLIFIKDIVIMAGNFNAYYNKYLF